MRRLTAWIGGLAGGIAAYRFFQRHPKAEPAPSPEPAEADDRAEELRAKLAETRTAEPVVEEQLSEPPPPEEGREPESPEERRRHVHDEARTALDEMRSDD
jgi:hypothetical protein